MYIILKGSVHVRIRREEEIEDKSVTNPVIITLYDGYSFGDLALINHQMISKTNHFDIPKVLSLKEIRHKISSSNNNHRNSQNIDNINNNTINNRNNSNHHVSFDKIVTKASILKKLQGIAEDIKSNKKHQQQNLINVFQQAGSNTNKRSATIEAAEETHLLAISKDNFSNILLNLVLTELRSKFDLLKKIPFLEDLEYANLITLANFIEVKEYGVGDVIMREGQDPQYFCIIQKGRCELVKEEIIFKSKISQLTKQIKPFVFNSNHHPKANNSQFNKEQKKIVGNLNNKNKNKFDFYDVTSDNYINNQEQEQQQQDNSQLDEIINDDEDDYSFNYDISNEKRSSYDKSLVSDYNQIYQSNLIEQIQLKNNHIQNQINNKNLIHDQKIYNHNFNHDQNNENQNQNNNNKSKSQLLNLSLIKDMIQSQLNEEGVRQYQKVFQNDTHFAYCYLHDFGSLQEGEYFMGRSFLAEQSKVDPTILDTIDFDPFEKSRLTIIAETSKTEIAMIDKNHFHLVAANLKKIILEGLTNSQDFDHIFTKESQSWINRWEIMKNHIIQDFQKHSKQSSN